MNKKKILNIGKALIFLIAFFIISCNAGKNVAPSEKAKPIAVITIDTANSDIYNNALKIFNKYNFNATLAVTTDSIGQTGYLTSDLLKRLQDKYKWEIASGSTEKEDLIYVWDSHLKNKLEESKHTLEYFGLQVNTFIIPYGTIQERQIPLINEYYKNIRLKKDELNCNPLLRTNLWSFSILQNTTNDDIMQRINLSIEEKEPILIFNINAISKEEQSETDNITPKKLDELLSLIKNNQLNVMNLNEALDYILGDANYEK